MNRSKNETLNQPFEFDEVLISAKAARSLGSAAVLAGAFGEPDIPSVPENVSTRKLSVRLRTINNACEGPFQMADGSPITEVSLYGSRERQFLIGPYWGMQRLMEGTLPWEDRIRLASVLKEACGVLTCVLGIIDVFLDDPNAGSTKARLEDAQRSERALYEGKPFVRPNEANTAFNVKMEQQIDLNVEQIDRIRIFSRVHCRMLKKLNALRAEVEAAPWWWGLSTALKASRDQVQHFGSEYLKEKERLRPPDWPRRRANTFGTPDYAIGFFE